jgi:hypothetical protein
MIAILQDAWCDNQSIEVAVNKDVNMIRDYIILLSWLCIVSGKEGTHIP